MQILPDGALGDAKDVGDLAHRVSGVAEDNCRLAADGEWRYWAREGAGLPPCPSGAVGCLEYERFTVTDQTTGQTWQQKVACDTNDVGSRGVRCDTVTAEVVTQGQVNARSGGNATPDSGSVGFTQVKVTDLNQTGAKAMVSSQWTTYKITEYGTMTVLPDVVPGPLTNTTNPSQSAFANTWKRLN